MSQTNTEVFDKSILEAKSAQDKLNDVYRDSIGLVDSLKNRSKKYMNQVSDIEDGLIGQKEEKDHMEENIKGLTKDIEKFNRTIRKSAGRFSKELEQTIENYNRAVDVYNSEKGQLTSLLNGRKRLLYLEAVIRKLRSKISSLQQMNNILFSFSEELKAVKEEYKENLVFISSELAKSSEMCADSIRRIELLN